MIGTMWAAAGKDPHPLPAAQPWRPDCPLPALLNGPMKEKLQPDMGESLQPPEHLRAVERRKHLQPGSGRFDQARLPRDAEFLRIAGTDDAYGLDYEIAGGIGVHRAAIRPRQIVGEHLPDLCDPISISSRVLIDDTSRILLKPRQYMPTQCSAKSLFFHHIAWK
jgi:hypothetical protein